MLKQEFLAVENRPLDVFVSLQAVLHQLGDILPRRLLLLRGGQPTVGREVDILDNLFVGPALFDLDPEAVFLMRHLVVDQVSVGQDQELRQVRTGLTFAVAGGFTLGGPVDVQEGGASSGEGS